MRIGPKVFGAIDTKWQREINGVGYLFHHVKYDTGAVHVSASKWVDIVPGGKTGCWRNVHTWVFYPG